MLSFTQKLPIAYLEQSLWTTLVAVLSEIEDGVCPSAIFSRIGNPFQLRVLLDQRRRSQHAVAGDHGLQFQCVYSRFTFEMIVGDHVGGLRALGDALNTFFPAGEFALVVEIVVAVVAIIGIEPLIDEPMFVVAAMQADVADRAGDVLGGRE